MVSRKCRDCGRLGDEDPNDPAPALCPDCYKRRLERISPTLESMVNTFGFEVACMWLEDALVEIGGEKPEAARRHVAGLLRGEKISYEEWAGR